ncbi:MAG: monovalent cation/H+ antiporter subunit D [Deltaproteobacteria bacterium]|nr:MAG: monovalent cation/H+ antiporter subunit D [Deltaproteobacteria bacterium]
MNHLILAPILIPALSAVIVLLTARADLRLHRSLSLLAMLLSCSASIALAYSAFSGAPQVYAMGGWPPPHGIVFVLDRLSATMLVLLGVLGLAALLYASQGWDARGKNFHALFHFQIMGLNGAFLTGDLFNLFVCFEILLIASYGLLLHGGGQERLRAGLHYVILNLVGSAFFVIGLALVYGGSGTLNMAELARKLTVASPAEGVVLTAAGLMLLFVFSIKAAAVPLQFWLPAAYANAAAPVACLFAIMTKVGLYGILRIHGLVYGLDSPHIVRYAPFLLLVGGAVTLLVGAFGALGSRGLRELLAWLVISSVGTALLAIGLLGTEATAAALYYMVHSTLAAGAMFLLAELIREQRGSTGDLLRPGPNVTQPTLLGGLFLLGALTVAGLPPTSGFIGKAAVLASATHRPEVVATVYAVVLLGGLIGLVTLSRAGSVLFWNLGPSPDIQPRAAGVGRVLPVLLLFGLTLGMSAGGGPLLELMTGVAAQATDTSSYIDVVLRDSGGHR